MTREQLLQSLRKLARKRGVEFEVSKQKGKGSHYTVRFGDKQTMVQSNLDPFRVKRILAQLGLTPADL